MYVGNRNVEVLTPFPSPIDWRDTWIYFVMSLFTSFGFAMGLYLAAQERQVRWLETSHA